MDGKQYFRDCCAALGIDCDKYFKIGCGENRGGRYRYTCDPRSRTKTQLYAIKYFSDENLFLAWNLREPKAKNKTVFSLTKKMNAIEIATSQVQGQAKKIEYGEDGEEIVYRFYPEGVYNFLKLYAPIDV